MHGYKFDVDDDFWKWLKQEIESRGGNVVFNKTLPNRTEPNADEQMNFVLDNVKFNENTVIVAHSLGAVLAFKIIPKLKKKINKLLIAACPSSIKFHDDDSSETRRKINSYCDWDFDYNSIKDNTEEIAMLIDENDSESRHESGRETAEKLSIEPKFVAANNKHFNSEKEPFIIEEILTTDRTDSHGHDESYGGQVRDCLVEIDRVVKKGMRVLLTTLTKRMAEELTDFLGENGVKCRYMHSEIDTFERTEILRELRLGKFDVLVGINLLREGIDVPEIGFVGVLDADKEGFLRDKRSLIQIIGRAARNSEARVVLYADVVTGSIKAAMAETDRRRKIQLAYNKKNNIVPRTIVKPIRDKQIEIKDVKSIPKAEVKNVIIELEVDMKEVAELLDFERAIYLRNRVKELEKRLGK